MVTDARNGGSVLSKLQDASRRIARKAGAIPEEIVSLIVAELWEQSDAPPAVMEYLTQKMMSLSQNTWRRERRAKQRLHKFERNRRGQQSCDARNTIENEDRRRIRDLAMQNCTDPLDRDLVLVLMDEHPEFETPCQVFQFHGTTNSVGYRRLASLKEKLRHQLSTLHLSN